VTQQQHRHQVIDGRVMPVLGHKHPDPDEDHRHGPQTTEGYPVLTGEAE
jgi:hypothetical protein